MSSDSRQQPPGLSNSTLHLSLSVAGFFGVIFLAGYIGLHINDFEDQLLYQPPVSRSQSLIGTPIHKGDDCTVALMTPFKETLKKSFSKIIQE